MRVKHHRNILCSNLNCITSDNCDFSTVQSDVPTGPIDCYIQIVFNRSLLYTCGSASSISLHFQSLFLPRCLLFTPAVLHFFSFCIFIIITSYLYFPSSFPLPLSFFQLYLLCTYIMFENVTSCVCTTSELIPGKCVQMCVNLGMQIMNGSLKFTDRGKG